MPVVLVLLLAAAAAQSLDDPARVVDLLPGHGGGAVEGRLDWTGGTLTVTGQGVAPDGVTSPVQRRLLGYRAAKIEALRGLLEVLGGVRIDAATTVSMSMVASDSVRGRVEGLVRGARVVPGSQREADGLYLLDVSLDLHGAFADAVLPTSAPADGRPATDLPGADSVIVFVAPEPYTGLVVDARGTDLRPSLSPRIVDDSGRTIYAADHVERDYAVRTGIVGYERDLQRAAASERVGGADGHAFVVAASGVSGPFGGDVVVTRDIGTRIRMADMEGDFLSQCRVVFIVGPRPPASDLAAATAPDSIAASGGRDSLDSLLDARPARQVAPADR